MSESVEKKSSAAMSGQKLFTGRHHHTLDERKRLTIPADWRAMVGEPDRLFVWKAAHGKFLQVLPMAVASQRMTKHSNASLVDKVAQRKNKIIADRSDVVPWDEQGRIKLRDDMLKYAGIEKKVCLIAAIGCFEIWSEEAALQQENEEPTTEQIEELVADIGL
jgi:MraZ protein